MTDSPSTAQGRFWQGDFGDAYTDRNAATAQQIKARIALWARLLQCTIGAPPAQVLEIGSNIGNNLRALRALTDAELHAVEPNERARKVLVESGLVPEGNLRGRFASSIDVPDASVDLVFTSGVLIHIHPDDLPASCREIHRVARRYIGCIEYFSDKPEQIPYRGHGEVLFKRDFGGFWLDSFPDLRILDYGFAWKRATGLDNLTWWMFEKRG
jgi:spore coat polysaccharide biosynthesis protein SpsF